MNVYEKLLEAAYVLAARSPDPSNQNGAIVVDGDLERVRGRGCNDFGRVVPTEKMLFDREEKLKYIEHAERAAIYHAAENWCVRDCVLVCPWVCCTDCARAIARCGIKTVVTHSARMDTTPDRWVDSVLAGHSILRDYGVEIEYYHYPVKAEPILVNGKAWSPNTFGDGKWTNILKK